MKSTSSNIHIPQRGGDCQDFHNLTHEKPILSSLEPTLWNTALGRRKFLKTTGAATAGTTITLNGLVFEVLASDSEKKDKCFPPPETTSGSYYKKEERSFTKIKLHIDGGSSQTHWYATGDWTAAGTMAYPIVNPLPNPLPSPNVPADWNPPAFKQSSHATGTCNARRVSLTCLKTGPEPDGGWEYLNSVTPPAAFLPPPIPSLGDTIGDDVITQVEALESRTVIRIMKMVWTGEATYECGRQ